MDNLIGMIMISIIIILYSEVMWWLVKTKKSSPSYIIGVIYRGVMYFQGLMAIVGSSTPNFVNFYFMSLYYFVIYRERSHELQEKNEKGTTT